MVYSITIRGAAPAYFNSYDEAVKTWNYCNKYFSGVSFNKYSDNEFIKRLIKKGVIKQ